MSLELLGMLLELLLLLLYAFYHVLIGGREAPPLELRNKCIQQKQQQLQQQPQQLQGHFGNFLKNVWPHLAWPHVAFSDIGTCPYTRSSFGLRYQGHRCSPEDYLELNP